MDAVKNGLDKGVESLLNIYPKIGSDEVGKGDFFGPLVVCAVFMESIGQVEGLAIRDSKTISDSRARVLTPQLMRRLIHSSVKISPEKYNELYRRFKNINVILGWAHAQAIRNLLQKKLNPSVILIDKFGPEFRVLKHLDDTCIREKTFFSTHAEKDAAVAAASVIARGIFLDEIRNLSRQAEMEIPLGAGQGVDGAARKLSEKIGKPELRRFVKIHFKNFSRL